MINKPNIDTKIASLDVESLFTNVPVKDTIDIILNKIYNSDINPLDIPRNLLKKLLEICTMEAPFLSPDNKLYKQIDGVAMGSPLGVLFANFYMGHLEETLFKNNPHLKPKIYCRYVDDIFIAFDRQDTIDQLLFELNKSKLKFTIENSVENKLPFLDVLIQHQNDEFITSVYIKPSNKEFCLNGNSECSETFLNSTITSYVNRAYTHCSNIDNRKAEIKRVSKLLLNNNYKQAEIDKIIHHKEMQHNNNNVNNNVAESNTNNVIIYYRNIMSTAYKKDEKIMRRIIKNNVRIVDNNNALKFRIYYKNKKTSSLILKNNNNTVMLPELKRSHLVYSFKCNIGECEHHNSEYIGETETDLSRRLTMHKQNGAIKDHLKDIHNVGITRQILENNTKIIHYSHNHLELMISEAILIDKFKPIINTQKNNTNFRPTLKFMNNRQRVLNINNN